MTTDTPQIDDQLDQHLRRTLRAVAATVHDEPGVIPVDFSSQPSRGGRPIRRIAVVAAAAAVVAGAVLVLRPDGSGVETGPAENGEVTDDPAAVGYPEAAPRLLVTAEGWELTGVSSNEGVGHMLVEGPAGELSIYWIPGDVYGPQERIAATTPPVADITVAGQPATVVQDGTGDTAMYYVEWQMGSYYVRMIGQFGDETNLLLDVASSFVQADTVDTWLAALPDDVVRPVERPALARQVLADVPVPSGFDTTPLLTGEGEILGRLMLGMDVVLPVFCAWTEQWIAADQAGDTAAKQEATEALMTSLEWDVLQENADAGNGTSGMIWEWSEAMAGDGTIPYGTGTMPIAEAYPQMWASQGC